MSFKNYDISISYKSVGEDTISNIVNTMLKDTVLYKRSVGFFSASALNFISDGISGLVNNKGKIQIITSPELSNDDINAINLGYQTKEQVVLCNVLDTFENLLNTLTDENCKKLADLIINDVLDIRIVSKKDGGIYHDKVAILKDNTGNKVAFVGSSNETASGYSYNYEKIRTYTSWNDYLRVFDEENDFDNIWNGNSEFLDTFNFKDAIKNKIINIVNNRTGNNKKENKPKYELYDYQKEAIKSWVNNNYNGFYVMATGTGKTVTSIYSIKELLEKEEIFTVIAVPYKHLILQWEEDVVDILGSSVRVIKVSSENPGWDNKLKNAILSNKYNPKSFKPIVVISTIASFYDVKFNESIKNNNYKRLLVVDEAHNFLNKILNKKFDIDYEYKLGLSATPIFGSDENKTNILVNFFGGIVYNLPIEKAIGKFLVNYYYYPIFVYATEEEEKNFDKYRKLMIGCYDKDGKIKDPDLFTKYYRAKLRVISMAKEKIEGLPSFISKIKDKDHFIIYCSDGKINDKKHLLMVNKLLNDMNYKPSQFTCEESMNERKSLIDNFNKGIISPLVAIRCLDEGINIPSIKTALILSSNDNYREFVQRRGRILRKFKGKSTATILDVIVLPSNECKQIAEIEFRRFYEYAKLSLNSMELMSTLNSYLSLYDLTIDDIKFKNEYIDDVELDEN